MPERSAGILLYRLAEGSRQVLLVHPGGPFWVRKDAGAWTIPKGRIAEGEDAEAAARREFEEETGSHPPDHLQLLGTFRQPSGKLLTAFAGEGAFDPRQLKSNLFELQWPPHSGLLQFFPEVDRGAWFEAAEADEKILKGQRPILQALSHALAIRG